VNDKRDAVAVIASNGIIKIGNKNLHKMFGYKKDELIGKNVSVLMPAPYSQQHNSYLKRHVTTGQANILGSRQRLEGRHKLGYNFPINLQVSKVESGGEVSFMGVMTRIEEASGVQITCTKAGVIRSTNLAAQDMFGFTAQELLGKSLGQLLTAATSAPILALVAEMADAREADEEVEEVDRSAEGQHKNGAAFPVSLTLGPEVAAASSLAAQALARGVVVRIAALDGSVGLITIDEYGNIKACNAFASLVFGYTAEHMTQMNVSALMPRPCVPACPARRCGRYCAGAGWKARQAVRAPGSWDKWL
jgi:PAS domain S-box-containing protein